MLLAVVSAAFFLAFLGRYATAVIVPELEASFEIGPAEIGLLGAAYFWAYALMQPPSGLLSDSIGPRRAIVGFMLLSAAGTAVFALAGSFPLALAARTVAGLGAGTVYVCATRLFSRWFRADEFGAVAGLFGAVGNLGGLTAAGPLAGAIGAIGWRESFLALAALTLVAILGVWVVVRDAPPGMDIRAERMSLLAGAGEVLRHRNTWLLGVYAFVTLGILAAMQGLWTVPYLRDVYGMSKQGASNALSLWSVGLIAGLPLWGYIADRVARSRRRVLLLCTVLNALMWAVFAARPAHLPLPFTVALLLWGGFTGGCWVPAYAQLKDSLPPAIAGTALGFLNFAFFAGAAAFQQATGLLLDRSGLDHNPEEAYRVMFVAFFAVTSAAAVAVWFSRDAHPGNERA